MFCVLQEKRKVIEDKDKTRYCVIPITFYLLLLKSLYLVGSVSQRGCVTVVNQTPPK